MTDSGVFIEFLADDDYEMVELETQEFFEFQDMRPPVTGTGVSNITKLTQADYNLLSPPDPNTLYVIVG